MISSVYAVQQCSLQPGTGARGSCEAARTFKEHMAVVGFVKSNGNRGNECGWAPRSTLLGCQLVCNQFRLLDRNILILE